MRTQRKLLGAADALVRPRGVTALTRGRADEGVRPSEITVRGGSA